MNFSELARYRGILIATASLVIIIFLFALASRGLQNNARQSSLVMQQVQASTLLSQSADALPSKPQFTRWMSSFSADQLAWLKGVAGPSLTSMEAALNQGSAQGYKTAFDKLSKDVQTQDDKRSRLLSIAPIAVCVLAVLFYLLTIIPQLLRLSKDKEVQVESNQQAQNILDTVSEGLFLLDKNGQIGVEQSASLKDMFRLQRDLEGSFLDFIGQYVSESSVTVSKDYLDLLYGDRVKEKLVKDLNPLNQVEISITRRDGSVENRFLDFKFARVMEDGELQHLLGSVTDVTREVLLQKELETNKEEQEAQLDLLMNILHLDKDSLARFYSETDVALNDINQTLQERGSSSEQIKSKLNTIAEQAHRIKGDAAALKLHNFEFIVHEFESEIAKVQEIPKKVTGRDVLPAVTKLKAVFKELNNMQSIVTRFSEVLSVERGQGGAAQLANGEDQTNAQASPVAQAHSSALVQELNDLVHTLAERNDVRVSLQTFGLGDGEVPEHLAKVVRESAIQMIRNSITHGAKEPAERLAQGKADFMTLVVSLTETAQGHTFIVRDDGDGLNQEKILAKALDKGIIKPEAAQDISQNTLAKLIFHPGFSTKDEVGIDAGRGVGLSAVYSVIKEAGGTIGVSQLAGKHCQFSVRFNNVELAN